MNAACVNECGVCEYSRSMGCVLACVIRCGGGDGSVAQRISSGSVRTHVGGGTEMMAAKIINDACVVGVRMNCV